MSINQSRINKTHRKRLHYKFRSYLYHYPDKLFFSYLLTLASYAKKNKKYLHLIPFSKCQKQIEPTIYFDFASISILAFLPLNKKKSHTCIINACLFVNKLIFVNEENQIGILFIYSLNVLCFLTT